MPEAVIEQPVAQTETFADFHKKFEQPVSGDPDVEVNAHGVPDKDHSAAAGEQPNAESGDGSDPSLKQDKVEKRKQQIQRDIDAQVARREAAKREADIEEARLQKLRSPDGSRDPKDSAVQKTGAAATAYDGTDPNDPEPDSNKFDDWIKLQDARARWNARNEFRRLEHERTQAVAQEQQKRTQEEQTRGYQAAVSDFETRGNEFAAEHPEYTELVEQFRQQKISSETEAFLLWGCKDTEGPEVLMRLMQEPDKLKEIEKLPTAISRFSALYAFKYESRIAQLESQLASQPNPAPQKQVSKAPPTGSVLRGAGGGASVTTENATSYKGFKTAFDKKEGLR